MGKPLTLSSCCLVPFNFFYFILVFVELHLEENLGVDRVVSSVQRNYEIPVILRIVKPSVFNSRKKLQLYTSELTRE